MKILWFDNTDLSKPGSGQVTKTVSLLKALSRYADITLVCPCENIDKLKGFITNIVTLPPFSKYDYYFSFNLFKKLLFQIKNKYNFILYSHIYSIFSLLPLRLSNIPFIYDCHGVEFELINKSSIKSLISVSLLESFAMKIPRIIIVMNNYDKKKIQEIYRIPDEKIVVIPPQMINNPCTYEEKLIARNKIRSLYKIHADIPIVLFHGSLKYGPNADAVNVITKKIAPKLPQHVFFILGSGAPLIGKVGNIIFTGFVENLREFLCAADIAIVPISKVTGVNMKILDYISHGVPVVATPVVLKWLDPDYVDGSFFIANIDEFPEVIERITKTGARPTKWKRERSIDDVAYDYYKILRNLL